MSGQLSLREAVTADGACAPSTLHRREKSKSPKNPILVRNVISWHCELQLVSSVHLGGRYAHMLSPAPWSLVRYSTLKLSLWPRKAREMWPEKNMQYRKQGPKYPGYLATCHQSQWVQRKRSSLATGRSGRIFVTMAIPHSQPSSEEWKLWCWCYIICCQNSTCSSSSSNLNTEELNAGLKQLILMMIY